MQEIDRYRAEYEIYERYGSSIVPKNGRRLYVKVDDMFDGLKVIEISIKDVVEYYATEANSMSGMRVLGTTMRNPKWKYDRGIAGDWRQIDAIASACLDVFKIVNLEGLKREARKHGLEPRF